MDSRERDLNLTILMHKAWSTTDFGYKLKDCEKYQPGKYLSPTIKSYTNLLTRLNKRKS